MPLTYVLENTLQLKAHKNTGELRRGQKICFNLKYNKYYEHIPTIINEFCGLPAPRMTPELEQQLKIMFDEIQNPFEKYSKIVCPFRKNFLNYNFIFYKMCQLLGKDEFLSYFSMFVR